MDSSFKAGDRVRHVYERGFYYGTEGIVIGKSDDRTTNIQVTKYMRMGRESNSIPGSCAILNLRSNRLEKIKIPKKLLVKDLLIQNV